MRRTHGEEALFVVALMGLCACADPANRIEGPKTSADIQTGTADPTGGEREALTDVARLVAVALNNEPARQHLKRDMRAAPFREHKLELVPYLGSKDGKSLLSAMAAAKGAGEDAVIKEASAIRRLEFYMPVPEHREKWTGKTEVLVVSQLEEASPIVAFDSRGHAVALDRKAAPGQATLSIVPVETRFDRPMNPATSRNARDENGDAIGTLEPLEIKGARLIACDASCKDGGGDGTTAGSGTTIPSGLYLEFSRIVDAKEPWFRGAPEIEVHIQGPTDLGNTRYGADLSCAGEHPVDSRKYFDQNDAFWSGRAMLFSADEVNSYNQNFTEGFDVMVWEDDDTECSIKTDTNSLVETIQQTAKAAAAGTAVKVLAGPVWLRVGTFIATLFSNASWLLTSDDFLGVEVDETAAGIYYGDATHVLMLGGTINGRARLVWH
jgi:hypothetical protein